MTPPSSVHGEPAITVSDAELGLRLRAWLAYAKAEEERIEAGPGLSDWQQAYAEGMDDIGCYVIDGVLSEFIADNVRDFGPDDPELAPVLVAKRVLEAGPR